MNDTQLKHHLNIQAFNEFAHSKIPTHMLGNDGERFEVSGVQLVFEAFLAGQGPAGAVVVGQQLLAGIKESSKYFSQVKLGRELGWPYPFPVHFQVDPCGYVIKGGIGGQYRLEDVDLFVIEDGEAKAVLL
ncbi:hypothetical protein OE470_06760 [Pseudomonas aeruginosa]|nr:hypothetical protein [Pseudomonas aeruginosa]MCU9088384.1 hypothetical protein [Pseudomonas aeruginosa]